MLQHFNKLELDNVLDKDLEKMLHPLNLMQLVLLQPKYRIIQGAIKQNNVFSHMLCLVGFSCIFLMNASRLLPGSFDSTPELSEFMYIVSGLDSFLHIMFCVLMCILNFHQSKNNVLLILKIQQAYRIIGNQLDLKKQRNLTWIGIFSIALVYIMFLEGSRQIGLLSPQYFIHIISLLYFDANIFFAIRILNFLVFEVKLWLVEMGRFEVICSQTDHVQLTKYLEQVRRREEALFKAWMDIAGAFNLCGKLFHLQILMLATDIFVQPLFYVQMFIEISKSVKFFFGAPVMTAVSIVILVTLVTKNLVLLVCVCAASEHFASAVADTDEACTRVISGECLANIRRLCKNVRRVNACARGGRGLRAGGALAVDAALPLRQLALLATYTVVLLQFALL